jgi:hypothetical protein
MPPFNAKRLARGLIRAADRDPALLRRNMDALPPAIRPSTDVMGGQVEELVSIAVVAAHWLWFPLWGSLAQAPQQVRWFSINVLWPCAGS